MSDTVHWRRIDAIPPKPSDADKNGDIRWKVAGWDCLGRLSWGIPVDATHWTHTDLHSDVKMPELPEYFVMWRLVFKTGATQPWNVERTPFSSWKTAAIRRKEIADEFLNVEVIVTAKFPVDD